MARRIVVKKKNGIDWLRIELDLDELEREGSITTEDDLGWTVRAWLIERDA